MFSLELGNITGKIEGLVYNNAQLIGFAGGVLDAGLSNIINNLTEASKGNIGIPNMQNLIGRLIDPSTFEGGKTWLGIEIVIGGWLLKEIGFGGRLGGAIETLGKGFIAGNITQDVLDHAVHDHY